MSIIFTNPHGKIVRVPEEETEVIDQSDGEITRMAMDPETGEPMISVEEDDTVAPESMEAFTKEQLQGDLTNMMEEVESNPPKKLFTWKNLRLQSAIAGSRTAKGRISGAIGAAGTFFGRGISFSLREIPSTQSIRDAPFLLQLTTAEQWYDYISNMAKNPVDMGAELSAMVTPSQKISVAMFVKEAEMDPGFTNLLKKATPGADAGEIVTMGTMVYDLMTGKGPNPLQAKGYGTFKYDKMFRLAYDILQSMPIRQYNSYTLFQLEADEGGQVFAEVTRNYTPLEMSEVGLITEMRNNLAEYGPGYANMVISDASLAAEAGALMNKAVSAYNSGDTVTVRSILSYLQDAPFYYMTVAQDAKNIFEAEDGNIQGVRLENLNKAAELNKLAKNGLIYIKDLSSNAVDNATGKLKTKDVDKDDDWKGKSYEVIKSPFDNTVAGVITFQNDAKKYTFAKGATMDKKRTDKDKKSQAAQLADIIEGRSNPGYQKKVESILVKEGGAAGLKPLMKAFPKGTTQATAKKAISKMSSVYQHKAGDYILKNPRGKPTGRGKYYNLEVHAKSNLNMKLKPTTSGGQGDLRHGAPPKGKDGSQNTWTKGLYKLLQADVEAINKKHMRDKKTRKPKLPEMKVMVTGGKHKKTGKWAPYRIKLPKSHFATSRLPDGTQSVGLRSGKATPAMKKAWQNFTDEYGIFVRNDNKGTEFRFTPSKKAEHRGAYQDRFRRQVGGAKRSR